MTVKYLFLILVAILPFQFALNVSNNFDLAVTRIIVPLILFLWLARGLAKREVWITNKSETWILFAFLFLSAISLAFGDSAGKGFRKLFYLFTVLPIFWVASDFLRESCFRIAILKTLTISGALAAVSGIIQFFLQFMIGLDAELKYIRFLTPYFLGQSFGYLVENNSSWLVNISGKTFMRAFGFFPDPHAFSFFVSLCFFASLSYIFLETRKCFRYFAIGSLFLMVSAVALSFSRGAYLGMSAGIVFFAVAAAWEKKWFKKGLVAVGFLGLAIFLFNPTVVSQRFSSAFNVKEGSNSERINNWQQATKIVISRPLFGVGLGNYASQIDPMAGERSSIYAHSTFLDLAAETGIMNGLIFILLIFIAIGRFLKKRNVAEFSLAGGLVYFLVHGIFDTPLWSPQVMVILLVIVAMGLYPIKLKTKSENVKTTA